MGGEARPPSADELGFRDKFIAVVDILGFSRRVEAAEQGDSDVTLADLLSYGEVLAQQVHVEMIADSDTPPPICPNSRRYSRGLDYEVTQVSDGVVVSSEVSPSGLINLLQHVHQSVLRLLVSGVMVRGYILQGKLFHDGGRFLGTGYQEAIVKEKSVEAFRRPKDSRRRMPRCYEPTHSDGGSPFVEIDQRVVRYATEETDECIQRVFRDLTENDGRGHTVVFPYRQLVRIATQGQNPETILKSLEWAKRALADFLLQIEKHSPKTDEKANAKSKHLRRILADQLSQCDRIADQVRRMQDPFPPGSLADL